MNSLWMNLIINVEFGAFVVTVKIHIHNGLIYENSLNFKGTILEQIKQSQTLTDYSKQIYRVN